MFLYSSTSAILIIVESTFQFKDRSVTRTIDVAFPLNTSSELNLADSWSSGVNRVIISSYHESYKVQQRKVVRKVARRNKLIDVMLREDTKQINVKKCARNWDGTEEHLLNII